MNIAWLAVRTAVSNNAVITIRTGYCGPLYITMVYLRALEKNNLRYLVYAAVFVRVEG